MFFMYVTNIKRGKFGGVITSHIFSYSLKNIIYSKKGGGGGRVDNGKYKAREEAVCALKIIFMIL